MVDLEEYKNDIRNRIAETKRDLEPLEKGEMTLATRKAGATEWTDTTDDWIKHHRETIALYERILAKLGSTEPS